MEAGGWVGCVSVCVRVQETRIRLKPRTDETGLAGIRWINLAAWVSFEKDRKAKQSKADGIGILAEGGFF